MPGRSADLVRPRSCLTFFLSLLRTGAVGVYMRALTALLPHLPKSALLLELESVRAARRT